MELKRGCPGVRIGATVICDRKSVFFLPNRQRLAKYARRLKW
jgi:hypothetical protein